MDQKGFSALAADSNYGAAETLALYDLRDKSEKQYMVLKTQLGNRVYRTHFTEGVRSKGFVAFIASIIRYELGRICRQTGLELTTMLREANFLCLQRAPDNTYMGVHNANTRQLELMEAAGLNESDIDYFAREETRRCGGEIHDQVHKMPPHENTGRESETGKKPGRPPGSTRKEPAQELPRRKPGRPPGSKNKPKPDKTAMDLAEKPVNDETEKPRRRGRPPGSKNKKPAVNAKAKRLSAKTLREARP